MARIQDYPLTTGARTAWRQLSPYLGAVHAHLLKTVNTFALHRVWLLGAGA